MRPQKTCERRKKMTKTEPEQSAAEDEKGNNKTTQNNGKQRNPTTDAHALLSFIRCDCLVKFSHKQKHTHASGYRTEAQLHHWNDLNDFGSLHRTFTQRQRVRCSCVHIGSLHLSRSFKNNKIIHKLHIPILFAAVHRYSFVDAFAIRRNRKMQTLHAENVRVDHTRCTHTHTPNGCQLRRGFRYFDFSYWVVLNGTTLINPLTAVRAFWIHTRTS